MTTTDSRPRDAIDEALDAAQAAADAEERSTALERAELAEGLRDPDAAVRASARRYTAGRGRQAGRWMDRDLDAIEDRVARLNRHMLHGVRGLSDDGRGVEVLDAAARIQRVRAQLAALEASLTRSAARDDTVPKEGNLPDGRPYTVLRGADRKGWDHEAWKADVRTQVLSGLHGATVVNATTGEPVDVRALLEGAQAVHGATAPKSTELKALGLHPSAYCETTYGAWGLKVVGSTATDALEALTSRGRQVAEAGGAA